MKSNLITKKGGSRKGSGAKLKYGEELHSVSIKVPKSRAIELREVMKRALKEYLILKPKIDGKD